LTLEDRGAFYPLASARAWLQKTVKSLSTWDWLVLIVRNWERMEEVIETQGAGPWFYSINERDLTRLRV
jgi:hypothetical protein